jgi:hypothetical protein
MFFNFYNFTSLNSTYQEKLKEQLMSALRQRRNLCAITENKCWRELPIELVESILSKDDLPIASEAEVLTLIAQWLGRRRRSKEDVARLLGTFRKSDSILVRVSDIEALMQALGYDVFSAKEPRTGSMVWDPAFVVHRQEQAAGKSSSFTETSGSNEPQEGDPGEICHQLGSKDILQQEPGWMHPGVHRCHVTLTCNSWSHRERRLLRNPGSAANHKRAFEYSPSERLPAAGRVRSPSPPLERHFQVRMPPLEAPETRDFGERQNQMQDKIDHEIVDHQIICGVSSGPHQRHGVRFSQRVRNAIYLVEDLNGKQTLNIGGTTTSVNFHLELQIGEASTCGISKCRFALLRNQHPLMQEWFDVSAKVPLKFYIASACFDVNTSYTVSMRWHSPEDQQKHHSGRHFYIGS